MTTGYSGTPLAKKLGVAPGLKMLALDMPASVLQELVGDDKDLKFAEKGAGPWHVIVQFVTSLADLATLLPGHMETLAAGRPKKKGDAGEPAGMIWVAWPKKSPPKGVAKIETDITEDRIRDVCLPMGLVDVKVCAIDETWSGLKLVVRKELR